jgi:hypothetical protein
MPDLVPISLMQTADLSRLGHAMVVGKLLRALPERRDTKTRLQEVPRAVSHHPFQMACVLASLSVDSRVQHNE